MAKIRRVARCYNCGVVLQDENPKKKGYIPRSFLENNPVVKDRVIYCDSCYESMKDINSGELNQNIDEQSLTILEDARASDSLIVWVVDAFNFNGTLKKSVIEKIRGLRVAVLVTKKDLLPTNVKDSKIEEFVRINFNDNGIDPVYIKVLNIENLQIYEEILNDCLKGRKGHDVYLIGDLNVGKTTIINNCLKFFVNKTYRAVRAIEYPQTKTIVMELPLSRSSSLYVLPGFALDISVIGKVEKKVQKAILPCKKAKIIPLTLYENQSVTLGNLAAFTLVKGKPTAMKIYVAEDVQSKKISANQLDNYFLDNFNKKEVKPISNKFINFKDFEVFEYQMDEDHLKHDIAIEGLGWITFISNGQRIQITAPNGVAIKESVSKVG